MQRIFRPGQPIDAGNNPVHTFRCIRSYAMNIRRKSKQTNRDIAGTGNNHLPFPAATLQRRMAFRQILKIPVSDGPAARQKSRTIVFFSNNLVSRFLADPERPESNLGIPGTTDLTNFSIGEDFLQEARILAFLPVRLTDQIHNIVPGVWQNISPPCAPAAQ